MLTSTALAQSVPIAAPAAPSAGAPKRPKINIAFSMIFTDRDVAYTTVAMTTRSILLIMFRYTLVNAASMYENATIRR